MSFQVFVDDRANQDIIACHTSLATLGSAIATKFADRVEHIFEMLRENPFLYAKGYRDLHHVTIHPFQYILSYAVVDSQVIVLAVFHGKRELPQLLDERLKRQP